MEAPQNDCTSHYGLQQALQKVVLALECPKCGAVHQVPWRRLSKVVHCTVCDTRFGLGRGGHVRPCERVHFNCPRCQERFEITEGIGLGRFSCPACALEMPAYEKGCAKKSVHGESEGRLPSQQSNPRTCHKKRGFPSALGRLLQRRLTVVVLLGVVLVGTALAAWFFRPGLDPELADCARKFTVATIQGDRSAIDRWVDPQQQADYRLWVRNVVRKELAASPLRGNMKIRVSLAKRESGLTWVQVTLFDSDQIQMEFLLAWHMGSDGCWKLEATQTSHHSSRRGSLQESIRSKRSL